MASDKTYALEARLNALVTKVNGIKSNMNALLPIVSANNATFLSGLSLLPHQTTSNSQDPSTGPYWVTNERDYINNLVNAVNNLQTNLQSHGFEA